MHWLRIDLATARMLQNIRRTRARTLPQGRCIIQIWENPSENRCDVPAHDVSTETALPAKQKFAGTCHQPQHWGLNMMTYNRCIGTRYCANNCPFKVCPFNWFNHNGNEMFAKPTRTTELCRIVESWCGCEEPRCNVEKCSMCQQRFAGGKLEAKKQVLSKKTVLSKRPAGAANVQVMPSPSRRFEWSWICMVSKERADERSYFLLEELGVKPTMSYKVKSKESGRTNHLWGKGWWP